ncbi:MAG TPA: hypothetical protein VGD22_03060 [Sphingobacteriaceae bacterium]
MSRLADPFAEKLFEMRLKDIYDDHSWIKDELTAEEFVALFPVEFKNRKPRELNMPEFDLDRDTFLKVLVAFKQSFG